MPEPDPNPEQPAPPAPEDPRATLQRLRANPPKDGTRQSKHGGKHVDSGFAQRYAAWEDAIRRTEELIAKEK